MLKVLLNWKRSFKLYYRETLYGAMVCWIEEPEEPKDIVRGAMCTRFAQTPERWVTPWEPGIDTSTVERTRRGMDNYFLDRGWYLL